MKKYIFCYLKKGPNRSHSKVEAAAIQEAHLKNIGKLAKNGSLILVGPFMDTGIVRGIFIFNVPSLEAAQKLVDTDPAVKTRRLIMELHEWYGSAALTQIPDLHKRIQAKSVTD